MKKILFTSLIATPLSHAAVIGFWDFNTGFDFDNKISQIIHTADIGSGTLYQQRADTDGNGKGGISYVDPVNGIDNSSATDDRGIAWNDLAKGGDNDAEMFIVINTAGFSDLMLSFDAKADDEPLVRPIQFDLKADFNALVDVMPSDVTGTIKDFAGGTSTEILNNEGLLLTDTLSRFSYDLSSFDMLEDQGLVVLRLDSFLGVEDLAGDTSENDELRFDNLLITGTAIVPEPASSVLVLLGSLSLFGRRRR